MKCPKCQYLGFETGDRCKNCGYDFSLLVSNERTPPLVDLPLRDLPDPSADHAPDEWANVADLGGAQPFNRADAAPARPLPLFSDPASEEPEHHPLVRVGSAPRPPLAVRRAPETPRLKTPDRPARTRPQSEPRLVFADQADGPAMDAPLHPLEEDARPAVAIQVRARTNPVSASLVPCAAHARVVAAGIDLAILAGIDLLVVYLTLRVAALSTSDWTQLPPWPLLVFLLLLAAGYFTAFAAVGGQTIGKMAARIRVVTEDGSVLPPAVAVQRTMAALIAIATLGASFVPALLGSRRAVHDRLTSTRVVALPAP